MPVLLPVPDKTVGDVFTETMWDGYIRDNINKLLSRGHRVLTVAQFSALTGNEGAKGTLNPDEVYLEVDATNGIQWHLAFETSETTYKWRFLGGPPLIANVDTAQNLTNAAYADLATDGPSIALPRGGDYDYEWGGDVNDADGGFCDGAFGLFVNAVFIREAFGFGGGTGGMGTAWRHGIHTGASSGQIAKVRYKTDGGAHTFRNRVLVCRPRRLRHDG